MAKRDIDIRFRGDEANLPENAKTIMNDLDFIIKGAGKELSDQAKYDIIHKIAWEWTEGQTTATKYYGCRYWSKTALGEKFKDKKIETGNTLKYENKNIDDLRHEHVVPKKLFIEYVWGFVKNSKGFDKDKLLNLMQKSLLACVVHKDEDSKLIKDKIPKSKECQNDFITKFEDVTNPWVRYEIAELTDIYELEWNIKEKEVKIVGKVAISK